MKELFFLFIATILFIPTLFAQTTPPVASYFFNGNANDTSGNNHHGVLTNATFIADRHSNPNNALNFNGTNAYVEVVDTAAFNVGKGSFSVNLWFRTSSTQAYMLAFASGVQCFGKGIAFAQNYAATGDIVFGVGANGICAAAESILYKTVATNFNDGAWHHAVAVVDQTNLRARLYVDNVLQEIQLETSFAQPGGTLINGNTELDITGVEYNTAASHYAYIGKSGNQFVNQSYQGDLDDVGFFDYALTAAEVTQLFNAGVSAIDKINSLQQIAIFPNPSNGRFSISFEQPKDVQLTVYGLLGEELYTNSIIATDNQAVDLSFLPNGIYLLKLESETGVYAQKVVVQKP